MSGNTLLDGHAIDHATYRACWVWSDVYTTLNTQGMSYEIEGTA